MNNSKTDIESLLFDVKKVKTALILPMYQPLSYNSIAVIDDKNRILNFCSEDYGLVKNFDIINAVKEKFKDFSIDIQGKSSHGNTRFQFDVIFKNNPIMSGIDPVFPKLSIFNSYNGRTKYAFQGGLYRQICTNGLAIGIEGSSKSISQIHTPSAEAGLAIEQINEIVSILLDSSELLSKPIEYLQDVPIKWPEERIYEVADATGFPVSQIEKVIERVQTEAKQLEMTDWIIYNGFNFQLNHNEDFSMAPDKRNKLDMNIFDYMIR